MTKGEAVEYLDQLAESAISENYHTEADALYRAAEEIERLTGERTMVIIPDPFGGGIETLVVEP